MSSCLKPNEVVWRDLFDRMSTSEDGTEFLAGRASKAFACVLSADDTVLFIRYRPRKETIKVSRTDADRAFLFNESLTELWDFLKLNHKKNVERF